MRQHVLRVSRFVFRWCSFPLKYSVYRYEVVVVHEIFSVNLDVSTMIERTLSTAPRILRSDPDGLRWKVFSCFEFRTLRLEY